MNHDDLRRAERVARGMVPELTPEIVETLRNRAAAEFFGEAGIPEDLKAGWAKMEERRKIRRELNRPLPPGGCLCLGSSAVLAGVLAELHTRVATIMRWPAEAIRVRLVRDGEGRLRPRIEVLYVPEKWIFTPDPATAALPWEAQVQRAIDRVLEECRPWFVATFAQRIAVNDRVREDLRQEVTPWPSAAE